MKILINGSNLVGGGGAQVADSICNTLADFTQHQFVVVLSSVLKSTAERINKYPNVTLYCYDYPTRDLKSLLTGRNLFLDKLVAAEHVDMVFTIFAPMKWKPRVPHLAGFAISHLVMQESPFFQRMNLKQRIRWYVQLKLWKFIFNKTDYFYTENQLISNRLEKLFPNKRIYTVTNYYNQIFDFPKLQKYHKLPYFNGWQILNVGSSSPHKNLRISIEIARILKSAYLNVIQESDKPNFRFLFTVKEVEFGYIPDDLKEHFFFIGRVDISEVPSLYEQTDIIFQPTLLECFTAVYPEAMRMRRPIVTTNLEFAHSLCGNAALYYSATDPVSAAEKIVQVISNTNLRQQLVDNGAKELKKFNDYNSRSCKLISICEQVANNCR